MKSPKVPYVVAAWTLAVLPFAWSVVVHSGAAPVPLSISVPPRPALSFRQYAVDLGPVHPTLIANGTFVFTNRGTQPVEDVRVKTSCGCLVPDLKQTRYEPGEEGRIVLRVQPANEKPGSRELFADVSYSDPEPREVRLTFKLEIPEQQMTVTPPKLMIRHPEGSEPTDVKFVVADGRKKPFEVTEVRSTSDLVSVEIDERQVNSSGVWEQTIHATIAGALPKGRSHTILRIMTTDVDTPELRVPILLEGPSDPKNDTEGDHEQLHGGNVSAQPPKDAVP